MSENSEKHVDLYREGSKSSSSDGSDEPKLVDFGTQATEEPELVDFGTQMSQNELSTSHSETTKLGHIYSTRKFDVQKAKRSGLAGLGCEIVTVVVLVVIGAFLDTDYLKYVLVLAAWNLTYVLTAAIMLTTNSCNARYQFHICEYIGSVVLFIIAVATFVAVITDFDDIDNDEDLKMYLLVVSILLLLLSGFKCQIAGHWAHTQHDNDDTKAVELNAGDENAKRSPEDTGDGEMDVDEELGLEDSVRTDTLTFDIIGQTGYD